MEEMIMLYPEYISYIMDAHNNHPRKPSKAFRKHDGKTPYWVHPLWCATAIMAETSLPEELRNDGALALLFHDVLEDTTVALPKDLPQQVVDCVHDMTFAGGFTEERQDIWSRSPEVRLFKLYDKVNNLMDSSWMSEGKKQTYKEFSLRLAVDVEKNFGRLNIVHIAYTICN